MTYQNYLATLSPIQKRKWLEKKGALCYYELFDLLHENFTLEEAGAILLGLIYYDKVGGSEPLPEDIEKLIDPERGRKVVFLTYTEKIAAASKEWINRHKLKSTEEGDGCTEAELALRLKTEEKTTEISDILPDDLPF